MTLKTPDSAGTRRNNLILTHMRRKSEEITAQIGHVHTEMRDRLRSVNDHDRPELMGNFGHELYVVRNPEDVGHVNSAHDLRTRADLGTHLGFINEALLIGIQVDELGARRTTSLLPGNQIGMVLHHGDAHFIARPKDRRGKCLGHDVERLRCIAAEDDVFRIAFAVEAQKAGDVGARFVYGRCRLDG